MFICLLRGKQLVLLLHVFMIILSGGNIYNYVHYSNKSHVHQLFDINPSTYIQKGNLYLILPITEVTEPVRKAAQYFLCGNRWF